LGETFWNAVRANLHAVHEAKIWADIVTGPITPVIEDDAFAAAALSVLPVGPYDGESWKAFTEAVKTKTGAKGKSLFMPLRLALTGMAHGPEMAAFFMLIGEAKARDRLGGKG
jgi:glutamyl-tRNA synthetase